jgi:hypothetical protein
VFYDHGLRFERQPISITLSVSEQIYQKTMASNDVKNAVLEVKSTDHVQEKQAHTYTLKDAEN